MSSAHKQNWRRSSWYIDPSKAVTTHDSIANQQFLTLGLIRTAATNVESDGNLTSLLSLDSSGIDLHMYNYRVSGV